MGVLVQVANEVRIGLNVTGEQQAKAKLKAVGDQAEKTGEQIEEMADQAVDAGKATEKAGDGFKKSGDDLDYLNKQIKEGKQNLRDLAREFARTGDSSLLKDINKQRRDVRKFEGIAKLLVPDADDVAPAASATGTSVGEKIVTSAARAISSGNPYVLGALIGVAQASAPAVGGILAAAVVGGVGTGGIIGGVALAAQDPRVALAGAEVGRTLLDGFKDAARPFVNPVLDSLERVGDARWAEKLAPGLESLSKSVVPITDSLIRFGDEFVGGLAVGLDNAGPLVEDIASTLPRLGDALGGVIAVLSTDTDGAAAAVEMLVGGISLLIETAGGGILILSNLYEGIIDIGEAAGVIEPKMRLTKATFNQTADAQANLIEHTEKSEVALLEFDKAIRKVFGDTLGVREATLGYEQAIDDLTEELTNGKRTLDETTQAGRDNWSAINDTVRSIEALRQANIDNGMSMEEAGAKYDAQLEDLRKTLLSLGYNKQAVNDYIDEMKGIPKQALTEIHLRGIKAALSDLKTLAEAIGAVTGYAILNVATNLGKRASGGPVSPGMNYIVGENGPELLSMKSGGGGYVYNARQTAGMVGGGGGMVTVRFEFDGADEEMKRLIRKIVKVDGGGDVRVAFDER